MTNYYIDIQPTDKSEEAKGFDLEDYSDKEELFEAIDRDFPKLQSTDTKCPICGKETVWDDESPRGWFCEEDACKGKIWSDESERDVVYWVDTDDYYGAMLDKYGFITDTKVHKSVFEFITAFDEAERNKNEQALIEYMDNMMFDASKHDIEIIYKNFKEDYVGYSGTSDDDPTEVWFGEYLVDNGIVEVPEHLQDCIDYADLAADYFTGGDYWHSNGYIFKSR